MKRIAAKAAVIILSVFLLTSCDIRAEQSSASPPIPAVPEQILSKDEVQADALQLVSVIEATHPAFSLNDIPPGYNEAKDAFLSQASDEMTVLDLSWLIRAYLSSLKDGHTSVRLTGSSMYLDVAWQAEGDSLYLLDENGRLTNQRVMKLGGIPVGLVFQTIGRYFAAENEAAADQNNTVWSMNKDILSFARVVCDSNKVTLTVEDGRSAIESAVRFTKKTPYFYYDATSIISSRMIGDVFYIEFNSCTPGPEVNETVSELKAALKSGVTKVIIDVRNNPGGDSSACTQLLEALGMKVPHYGTYIRYSTLSKEQRGTKASGFSEQAPNAGAAKPNPKINLAVLTSHKTFSSATMLAVFVQDGKLGTVIGQPSTNSPTCYGDILSFQLDNSHLSISVSYKRFIRPDTEADQNILLPDLPVPLSGDPLQRALNYLNGN